jgi:hypothetical protein
MRRMKSKSLWAVLLAAAALPLHAQTKGCDTPRAHELDFWLGDWELAYTGQDGKPAQSRNRITKILDGCVVLEEFDGGAGTPLVGRSVSMFDAASGRWKQTWVDNQGSYLDFTGGLEDGRMVLAREASGPRGRFHQRMVFEDVQRDSLRWLWQRSDDGGRSWTTNWEIRYRRVK